MKREVWVCDVCKQDIGSVGFANQQFGVFPEQQWFDVCGKCQLKTTLAGLRSMLKEPPKLKDETDLPEPVKADPVVEVEPLNQPDTACERCKKRYHYEDQDGTQVAVPSCSCRFLP